MFNYILEFWYSLLHLYYFPQWMAIIEQEHRSYYNSDLRMSKLRSSPYTHLLAFIYLAGRCFILQYEKQMLLLPGRDFSRSPLLTRGSHSGLWGWIWKRDEGCVLIINYKWISCCKASFLNPDFQSIWPFLWTFKKFTIIHLLKHNFSISHWMSQGSFLRM